MTAATTWHGRRGAVLLGPTENRVARWLVDRTSNGRVRIRMTDLVDALRLERSEAYRITARLRVLGLFGVENDRGGTKGGRQWWRTAIAHDGAELDPARHREAWSRIVGWARERHARVAARLAAIRDDHTRHAEQLHPLPLGVPTPPGPTPPGPGGVTFGDALRRYGLGPLLDEWAR